MQKGNQYLKGKADAFAGFRDVLAAEMIKEMPELKDDVHRVLEGKPLSKPAETNGNIVKQEEQEGL